MIKVSVLYPNTEGASFDMGYYCETHVPMVREKLGNACKGIAVEEGLAGGEPGSAATYAAMGHLYFDTVDAFQASFGPHAEAIMGDIPNFAQVEPSVQISEVRI
jgi:uncharacterized protein (TIGR02118 family)